MQFKNDRSYYLPMGKGDDTRAAILERATSEASVFGLDGISIGRLASLMGMSKSGLFAHFGSKEALQQAVVSGVVDQFRIHVVGPVLKIPTAEGRLRGLLKNWLAWTRSRHGAGGCPLIAASVELDDQPGALRDLVVTAQREWLDAITRMAKKGVEEGDFEPGLDVDQFAFDFQSIGLGHNHAHRLLNDPSAENRALAAFDGLINRAKKA